MKKLIAGLVVGMFVGWIAGAFQNPLNSATTQMVRYWGEIRPGMDISEVKEMLGENVDDHGIGNWSRGYWGERFPENYAINHGLISSMMRGLPPVHIVVAYDVDMKVTYVSYNRT